MSHDASINPVIDATNQKKTYEGLNSHCITAIVAILGGSLIGVGAYFASSMSILGSTLIAIGSTDLACFAYRIVCHVRATRNNRAEETSSLTQNSSTTCTKITGVEITTSTASATTTTPVTTKITDVAPEASTGASTTIFDTISTASATATTPATTKITDVASEASRRATTTIVTTISTDSATTSTSSSTSTAGSTHVNATERIVIGPKPDIPPPANARVTVVTSSEATPRISSVGTSTTTATTSMTAATLTTPVPAKTGSPFTSSIPKSPPPVGFIYFDDFLQMIPERQRDEFSNAFPFDDKTKLINVNATVENFTLLAHTVLVAMQRSSMIPAIETLIANGADVNADSTEGKPLQIALKSNYFYPSGHKERIISILVSAGAQRNYEWDGA